MIGWEVSECDAPVQVTPALMKNGVRHQNCKALNSIFLHFEPEPLTAQCARSADKGNCQQSSEYASTGDISCRMHTPTAWDNNYIQYTGIAGTWAGTGACCQFIWHQWTGPELGVSHLLKQGYVLYVCKYRPASIIILWFSPQLMGIITFNCHKWLQSFCKVDMIVAINAPTLLPRRLHRGL